MPGRCSFQSLKAVSGEPVLSPTHSSSAWAAGAHRCGGWQAPEARGQTRGCESDEDFRPQHESVPTPRRTVPSGGGGGLEACLPRAGAASLRCVHPGGSPQAPAQWGPGECWWPEAWDHSNSAQEERGPHPRGSRHPRGCQFPLIPALLQALPACRGPAGWSLSPSPFLPLPHSPFLTPCHPRPGPSTMCPCRRVYTLHPASSALRPQWTSG